MNEKKAGSSAIDDAAAVAHDNNNRLILASVDSAISDVEQDTNTAHTHIKVQSGLSLKHRKPFISCAKGDVVACV